MDAAQLKGLRLFAGLSDEELEHLAAAADRVDVPAGFHLVREGAFAYEFFVLVDGAAAVLQDGERIAELAPGDFFGEIGLLETDRRTATVVATTPVALLVLPGDAFERMTERFPAVDERIRSESRARLSGRSS